MSGTEGLWLYDGDCHFCSTSVRLVLRLDRRGAIRFSPIQSTYGAELARAHGIDPAAPQSFLFMDGGRAMTRSDAVIALVRRLDAPWRWLAAVRLVPQPWRDRAYDLLARHRYRLAGRRRTCWLPSAEQRSRFLLDGPIA